MRPIVLAALLSTGCWLAAMLGPAGAQARCPEGSTASGACVNPSLAQGMRKNGILATQPKLSYEAAPVLPIEDRGAYIVRDDHEMLYSFTAPPVSSVLAVRPIPRFPKGVD